MKKFIVLSFISLTLFLGCKKDVALPYNFSGTVRDINGSPISGASISLSAYYPGGALSGGNYSQIAKAVTNKEGNFSASFNFYSNAQVLMIQLLADNHFPYFNDSVFTSDVQNDTLSRNFTLYKLATIKISFKNVSPVSDQDEFYVYQTNELDSPVFNSFIERQYTGGVYGSLGIGYIGKNIQGYELTKTKGDSYTIISWSSNKNGVVALGADSLFIASGAQGNYNINY